MIGSNPAIEQDRPFTENHTVMQRIVPECQAGKRLDLFLLETDRFTSRHQIQKLVGNGSILVDGQPSKPAFRLRPGQRITVSLPSPEPSPSQPEAIPLQVLYEDEDLLVVNKAAGMVVHPAAGHKSHTLVNALLHHCSDLSGIGGILRPGIVHRLDKDTSGLLVVAKGDAVHQALSRQFHAHSVQREYQGLVYGQPAGSGGRIDSLIGRHPVHRKKMSSLSRKGRRAITDWKVEQRFRAFTLLRFTLHTGRTHQIRVHISEAGHPIVGDAVYGRLRGRTGGTSLSEPEKQALKGLNRMFLHARILGFQHPGNERFLRFSAPLPPELVNTLEHLRPLENT